MSEQAIVVSGLRMSYGDLEAVRGVDLQVDRGEIFALLGPNGAGKTTTVEILEGYRSRSAGDVSVLGHDPGKGGRDFKQRIGIVLQETGVEPFLTVAEVIDMYRGYYPNPRPVEEVIDVVGLGDKKDARVIKLSGGQRRRLDVAVGLAGDPELLFLDEPTTGFDPSARRSAWEMVRNLRSLGKTVFLTTHYMDEAQNLADKVALIVAGRIVAEGSPSELGGMIKNETLVTFSLEPDAPRLPAALEGAAVDHGGRFQLRTEEPVKLLHDLTGWALDNQVELRGLRAAGPTLEDAYLELTGAATSEEGGPV